MWGARREKLPVGSTGNRLLQPEAHRHYSLCMIDRCDSAGSLYENASATRRNYMYTLTISKIH
jgi:hypothetical protein